MKKVSSVRLRFPFPTFFPKAQEVATISHSVALQKSCLGFNNHQ